jgi:hypothetical protein
MEKEEIMNKFRRILMFLFVSASAVMLCSGCASNLFPGGPSIAGVLYTDVEDPAQHLAVAMDKAATSTKTGTSSAAGYLGLIATGDASVDAAMKDGGITKVHHVDHKTQLVLWGLWVKSSTIVYGE